jgi:hypothetical protein
MERPPFLAHLSEENAVEILKATAIVVLPACVDEGLILASELEYGYEDLPIVSELAAQLRIAFRGWHIAGGGKTDFRVAQKAFSNAFVAGLQVASQIHVPDGDGLRLDLGALMNLGGSRLPEAPSDLSDWAKSKAESLAAAFVTVQDKQLAIAASTKSEELLDDFLACACLWASLAGVEAGLERLQGV